MATSRGAGAAQRGYDYKVYKKGGKVRKYAEGGGIDRTHETRAMRFSDLFGSKKEEPKEAPSRAAPANLLTGEDELGGRPDLKSKSEVRETSRPGPGAAKAELPTRRPSQSAAQRRMAARRRQDQETMARDVAEGSGRDFPQLERERRVRESSAMNAGADPTLDRETVARYRQEMGVGDDPILAREAAARRRQAAGGMYAKGGAIKKYASGGSVCRGMGAATKGGKYKIK